MWKTLHLLPSKWHNIIKRERERPRATMTPFPIEYRPNNNKMSNLWSNRCMINYQQVYNCQTSHTLELYSAGRKKVKREPRLMNVFRKFSLHFSLHFVSSFFTKRSEVKVKWSELGLMNALLVTLHHRPAPCVVVHTAQNDIKSGGQAGRKLRIFRGRKRREEQAW